MIGAAGVPFSLAIWTSDPGPDTVTQIVVDWGDGSSSTISGDSGIPTHVYAADGHYTIRATTTDEDGSTWAEHEIDIGDDNPPPIDNGDPIITSANAVILANGNAQLTVGAENSAGGNSDLTYEWDLDGDGIFAGSGNSAEIPGADNPYRYTGWLRIHDGAGRSTEAAFAFNDGGDEIPLLSACADDDYRQAFKDATPGISESEWSNWDIHHPKQQQQALAARYLAERQINVHNLQDMRAVPRAVHQKFINPEQLKWWRNKAKELGYDNENWELVYGDKRVKWKDIDDLEAKLDKQFKMYFVPAGSNKATFDKAKNLAKKDMVQLALKKASRLKEIGLITLAALPVFELLANKAEAFENMHNFNDQSNAEFQKFLDAYEAALTDSMGPTQKPSAPSARNLMNRMIVFATDISPNDAQSLETSRGILQIAIDRMYPGQ